ncbi:HIT family protein [Enterococcus sp. DIV0242_7C1]|uniref:HIT family protein n=1 Tax=Candidatus Enterococcus dunnyi TaxID=1834192 RepID=A0A200J6J9_9ENTE|nr:MULTISPECIES: HIT family protein [unclassified Enterococcus]MBO0471641.1 HIT family protein [Enterococcus sp. DIV0242_7C1]MCA5012046.1 HIT family protein [Enterococcus sp. S23]MCA5015297.1 HIT family protein [Enterococcus sp. S22(2020)]OUZ32804.1 HIT family protein [Enterococcus sp. 9D6_DIV0238]
MTECIFCKIIDQEIPSYKVYEDDKVYAFLDITQVTKGHTLLVPKEHVTDIFEYEPALAGEVFARVPLVARALEKAFPEMQGLNIINNNKELAYQSVFHSHIHLIPRYEETDDFSIHFGNNQGKYTAEEMQEIADKIRQQEEA